VSGTCSPGVSPQLMPAVLPQLPTIAPIVARHLAAYAELVAADVVVLAKDSARRLVAATVAVLSAIVALLISSAWIAAVAWATPWRATVIGALILLFTVVAVIGAWFAARRQSATANAMTHCPTEWANDRAWIRKLSTAPTDSDSIDTSPLSRLKQSRHELRALLMDPNGQHPSGQFPRSATMRLLRWIPIASVVRMLVKT
jgi:uncharacterized membrane protein YqjE